MTLAPDWTTCEVGGVVYALHLPCRTAFLVPQEHTCTPPAGRAPVCGNWPNVVELKVPFQRALTVILAPDPGAAMADADLARIADGRSVVWRHSDVPQNYFNQLRLRAALDPSLVDKIAVFYRDAHDVVHEIKVDSDPYSWPPGFQNEALEIEQAICAARPATPPTASAPPRADAPEQGASTNYLHTRPLTDDELDTAARKLVDTLHAEGRTDHAAALVAELRSRFWRSASPGEAETHTSCGGVAERVEVDAEAQWGDNEPVTVKDVFLRCTKCGHEYYTPKLSMQHSSAVQRATNASLRARLAETETLLRRVVAWDDGTALYVPVDLEPIIDDIRAALTRERTPS